MKFSFRLFSFSPSLFCLPTFSLPCSFPSYRFQYGSSCECQNIKLTFHPLLEYVEQYHKIMYYSNTSKGNVRSNNVHLHISRTSVTSWEVICGGSACDCCVTAFEGKVKYDFIGQIFPVPQYNHFNDKICIESRQDGKTILKHSLTQHI